MNLSPEDLKRIAEIVTGVRWLIDNGGGTGRPPEVILYDPLTGPKFNITFHPSLEGTPQQMADALRVIVAAFAMDGPFQITGQDDHHYGVRLYSAHHRIEKDGVRLMTDTGPERDILQASCAALLSGGGR